MFSADSMGPIDLRLLHVLDGSMASSIESLGYDNSSTPAWSSGANLSQPELVVKTHLSYIDAGADILLTNTYQANIKRMEKEVGVEEATKLVTKGVELANKAVELSKKLVYVVGSIGSYGTCLGDCSEYTGAYLNDDNFDPELIKQNFETQAKALCESGAKVLGFETIPSIVEAVYAKEVLESLHCPGWISVTCKDEEHLANGDTFSNFIKQVVDSPYVKLIGINCTSPEYIKPLLKSGRPYIKNKGFVIYPNNGEKFDRNTKKFHGEPQISKIVNEIEDWIQLGVRIVGGCCRVTPDDIKCIAAEVNKLN